MAIIQRKNGAGEVRYLVRVRDPFGRWFPSATFERRFDAEKYERELLVKRDRGGVAQASELRQMTFAGYWSKWASECRNRVSEGWRRSQDRTASKYLIPMMGHRRLTEIRSVDIGQLLAALERRGLSSQSILHVYNVLHKAFEDAVEFYEMVDRNPVKRRFRPRVPRIEREFLSPADSWRLLEVARHHPFGPAVWVAMLAGLRPGEVQALRWNAVDFERSQILIRATFNKKLRILQDHPKQKDWGRAPMPGPLRDYLLGLSEGKKPEDWVCPNRDGGMLNYESFVYRVLPGLCKRAGVKRITPHELRHSCTEIYVQAGASAEDLRRLLNHKSLSATIRYMHRTDERLQGIAAKIQPRSSDPQPPGPATNPPSPASSTAQAELARPLLRLVPSSG